MQALDELCRLYCWQFYYATIFTPTRPTKKANATKKDKLIPKLVIYSLVQSGFRNLLVLCKIASHAVHCHDAEAAILKNLQKGRGDPGQVGVHKWHSDFPVIPVGRGKEEYVWRFPSFWETFRWNELYSFEFLTESFGFCWQLVNAPGKIETN